MMTFITILTAAMTCLLTAVAICLVRAIKKQKIMQNELDDAYRVFLLIKKGLNIDDDDN